MKNVMLMMSKIEVVDTLLTNILIISILGILLFLILNRNQKLKYLKKVTSVALILTMLLLPFTNLLNVKAEGVTIDVDSNNKATNTTDIVVSNIMGNEQAMDEFTAFKMLDVYYDKDTNEMSYNFTTLFENYKKSSYAQVTWRDNEYDLSDLTIEEYLNFTNDNWDKFSALVDSFSKYIKSDKTITGIDLVSSNNEAKGTGVEVGSYLILPSKLVSHKSEEANFELTYVLIDAYSIYDALIANAVFKASDNNWILEPCNVSSKGYANEAAYEGFLFKTKVSEFMDYLGSLNESDYPTTFVFDKELQRNTDYTYLTMANYYSNIENKELFGLSIKFPEGLDYSIDDIMVIVTGEGLGHISGGKIYTNDNKVLANISFDESTKTITVDSATDDLSDGLVLAIGIKTNDNIALGLNANQINVTYKFGANKYDPTSQQTLTFENNITTYGLQITNKSNSNDNLSGATFGLYTDEECTNKLGEFTTDSNGVASIKGVITGNYYVKQIKATSGYKLNSNVFTANITSENINNEGYYSLEITNDKMGLLPSTGGLGTIFYTLVGLIVIGLGAYEVIKYSKK